MQIDFHHAVTYVAARIAGFSHEEADTLAYAAQYVDDATCDGTVCFKNGAQYHRISTSHQMLDLKNLDNGDNREVWLPFHFLPGNGNLEKERNPEGTFINKLVCLPDSPIARDIIRAAIEGKGKPYGLHRLGVALHVYADTWAHQGFAGVLHDINKVEVEDDGDSLLGNLPEFLENVLDDAIPPLGHGRANVLPDMPFLDWSYTNGHGRLIRRNNPEDFVTAADRICVAMRRYLAGDPDADLPGIDDANKKAMGDLFLKFTDRDGDSRHRCWLEEIRKGTFTANGAKIQEYLDYNDKGRNSWKARALATSLELSEYEYSDGFLGSDWKRFHDAVQAYRFSVLHEILPKYGICAA